MKYSQYKLFENMTEEEFTIEEEITIQTSKRGNNEYFIISSNDEILLVASISEIQ